MFKHKLLVLLSLLCVQSSFCGKLFKKPVVTKVAPIKVPIVFHPSYDISLFGLQKLHPFDSCKYGKVYDYLLKHAGLTQEQFYKPGLVSQTDLLSVHTTSYLDSLNYSDTIAQIAEVYPLRYVPNFLLQRCLLNPMKYATAGTLKAAQLALEYGWAINLSGGYHHAKSECGGGFCFFADIPLAIIKILEKHPDYKVLIIDLDAHQGNGHESFFANDDRIVIMDVYNKHIYPHDVKAQKRIDYDFGVPSYIKDAEYLEILTTHLPAILDEEKPDFILYNAGTDIFEEDPLGRMKISAEGIVKRDELVCTFSRERNIPLLMVLSGGYTKKSAEIIGRSVKNLIKAVY